MSPKCPCVCVSCQRAAPPKKNKTKQKKREKNLSGGNSGEEQLIAKR